MVWPFSSEKIQTKDDFRIPKDLDELLKQEESTLSEREFKSNLKQLSELTNHRPLDPSPTLAPKDDSNAEKQSDLQSSEPKGKIVTAKTALFENSPLLHDSRQDPKPLTQEQLKNARELSQYKRENPLHASVLVNCADLQLAFLNCLTEGKFAERMRGCNVKNNFYQSCLNKQSMIFKFFDYNSMTSIKEFEEIKYVADSLFTKYYQCYDDLFEEEKNEKFAKELRAKREEFHCRFGK
ncbi:BA75_00250T0 [Komagataella pastoris]|uniref:BA75_00250T0 n=1 Tax=Komagataella pastoris TaxID=4922 RepID=A0A1B2J979_PICPA|nr:BA75_00250T0 [Komagataella pastoris]